jgi:dipeptidyl aminopeptidase/acylaminoacyl peptidase
MRLNLFRITPTLLAGWFMLLTNHAQAALSVDDAINRTGFIHATISPDGKHIAMIGSSKNNTGLYLMEVDSGKTRVLAEGKRVRENINKQNKFEYTIKAPSSVIWVGNDLLAVDYDNKIESMTLDGKVVSTLAESDYSTEIIGKADEDAADSSKVLVRSLVESSTSGGIYRKWTPELAVVDARTGLRSKFDIRDGSLPANSFLLDYAFDRHGNLRAVEVANSELWDDATRISYWFKSTPGAKWEQLASFKSTETRWDLLFVPDEENSLLLRSRIGRDTWAVFRYDTKKHEMAELLAGHPSQDIIGVRGVGQNTFKKVTTSGMQPQQIWFDAKMARIQAGIDQALPKAINELSGNPSKRVLIKSRSDIDPGTWFVFDTEKSTLSEVARVKLSIVPEQMKPMSIISYPAKDGLAIPAYLTRPGSSTTPQPTVVFVHGGPIARDHWEWNPDAQLLANQGYVVLQPQFRGSSGFGKNFETAGYGQWGLSMQDDITAGVEYLIKQGIADPKRICIYGASYGGYAALWGLAKTPELYRCGVSLAGVSDLELMFNDGSDTTEHKLFRESTRLQLGGDAKQNKEKFDQVSPLKHAAQITAPVLLAHGDEDRRVPIVHAKKMKAALEQNKKSVEWIELEDEGHGVGYNANRKKYYETLLAFLAKNLGGGVPAAKPTSVTAVPGS